MRKLFLVVVLTILFSFCSFADPTTSFQQFQNAVLVNLASTSFPRLATSATWGDYGDDQMLGLIGLFDTSNLQGAVKLDVNLISGGWYYILDGTDTRYKRPFGIIFFSRGSSSSHSGINSYSKYLGDGTQGTSTSVEIPYNTAKQYKALWWDMVLVFDHNVDEDEDTVLGADGTTYNLSPSNSYYSAHLEVSISYKKNGTTEYVEMGSYDLYLNGYYKSSDASSGNNDGDTYSNINFTKLATADSIDIKTLLNSGTTTKTDVATYTYYTNSIQNYTANGNVYFFLSSVNSGLNSSADEFILRRLESDGSISYRRTNNNTVKFYAYITSTSGNSSQSSTNKTVEFDGTLSYPLGSEDNYIVVPVQQYKNPSGSTYLYKWEDTATISVGIPSTQTINGQNVTAEGLVAGQYTSNVYLHIVTDF